MGREGGYVRILTSFLALSFALYASVCGGNVGKEQGGKYLTFGHGKGGGRC
jgi:hypothetical protein